LAHRDIISDMTSSIYSSTKNQLTVVLLFTLITLFALPSPAAALSCLNPAEMIERYATENIYTVALIEAGAIETEGAEHDQSVTIKTLYKGELSETDTVTFTFDETWNYLCAGGPVTEGTQALYILNEKQVVQVFTVDSELAQSVIAAIDTPQIQPTEVTEEETVKKGLMEQIIVLLKQIISLFAQETDVVELAPAEVIELADYIGINTFEAATMAEANNVLFRVVEIDGVPQMTTKDFREGRINASVENDIVTEYSVETMDSVIEETPITEPGNNDAIIGMTTDDARFYATTKDTDFRVGMIDGEPLSVTMDYRISRITAEVEKDIVTGYSVE
jgi:hypothetical protein